MQHVLGASLHPVLPRGDVPVHSVAPLMSPCHPSHAATLKACPVCRPRGCRDSTAPSDRQAGMNPGLFPSFLCGFWGAVFLLLPCLCGWDRGWHSCDTASPASCCLSPGHLPFSVHNKPRLVTAGDLCFVLGGAEGTEGWACGDTALGVREQTPVQVWALHLSPAHPWGQVLGAVLSHVAPAAGGAWRILLGKKSGDEIYPFICCLLEIKEKTSLSLKLNQTSLAQTKIYRHGVSPAGADQAWLALPPSLPVLHPSTSAARGGVFPGQCWPALGPHLPPTQSQLGARLRVPPGIGVCPWAQKILLVAESSGISGARWDPSLKPAPQGNILGSTSKSWNPPEPCAATRRSRGAASSRRWGCW